LEGTDISELEDICKNPLFLLVMDKNDRFDKPTREAFKQLKDIFKRTVPNRVALVLTHVESKLSESVKSSIMEEVNNYFGEGTVYPSVIYFGINKDYGFR
jgi:hypothetical protein